MLVPPIETDYKFPEERYNFSFIVYLCVVLKERSICIPIYLQVSMPLSKSSHQKCSVRKGVFLWILRNFDEHLFYRTRLDNCLFHFAVTILLIKKKKIFQGWDSVAEIQIQEQLCLKRLLKKEAPTYLPYYEFRDSFKNTYLVTATGLEPITTQFVNEHSTI